jgi:hypothetical protein
MPSTESGERHSVIPCNAGINFAIFLAVAKTTCNMNNKFQSSLLFCVLMDAIGYATYAVPFLGEFADVIWAPISAFIFFKTFGGWKGAFGGVFSFVEELLPGTDFIPTFTIMWAWQNLMTKNKTDIALKAA